jgi:hypothetical protein
MSPLPTNHKCRRQLLRAACAALVLIAAGVSLSACSEAPSSSYSSETASHHEPAKLEPIKGTDVKRVKFSADGAERVGLQTAQVRGDGQRKVIPYAAVIYDPEGNTFTYTSPEPLVYVREKVKVDYVAGDRVVLSEGPSVGSEIVTVGAAEVYGTEFEVAH